MQAILLMEVKCNRNFLFSATTAQAAKRYKSVSVQKENACIICNLDK
jgi:hypothetical protein